MKIQLTVLSMTMALIAVAVANVWAADAHVSAHQVFRAPYPDHPGTDVVVIRVDYAPGAASPSHEHTGFVYAYVLHGAVVSQVGDAAPQTYSQGQMWSELPHQRHFISRNASSTEPASLLVFLIAPHGQPLTIH